MKVALALPLLLFIAPLRLWIEADMALHMLVEFPLLVASGAAAWQWLPGAWQRSVGSANWHGLNGWLLFSLVSAIWMLPAALDAALLSPPLAAAKYLSWWLAGAAVAASWRASSPLLAAFFIGNWVWMTATVGVIYQNAPARLCLNYLEDSQQRAGQGLVIAAVLVLAGAAWRFVAQQNRAAGAASVASAQQRR